MARLKEMSPYHKFVKDQIHYTLGLGQVVLIKEDNIARGMWTLGKVKKLKRDSNGYIHTAKICLVYLMVNMFKDQLVNSIRWKFLISQMKLINF